MRNIDKNQLPDELFNVRRQRIIESNKKIRESQTGTLEIEEYINFFYYNDIEQLIEQRVKNQSSNEIFEINEELPLAFKEKYTLLFRIQKNDIYEEWCIKLNIKEKEYFDICIMRIYFQVFKNPGLLLQLLRQITILRQINHKSIMRIRDVYVGKDDVGIIPFLQLDHVIVVTDFYQYRLKDVFCDIPIEVAESIFLQIVEVVAILELSGFIHRNLSLENIYLDARNHQNIVIGGFEYVQDYKENIEDPFINFQAIEQYISSNYTSKRKKNEIQLDIQKSNAPAKKIVFTPYKERQNSQILAEVDMNSGKNSMKRSIEKQSEMSLIFSPSNQKPQNVTQLNFLSGNPNYRAPELILKQLYDNRVDSWALGCIFAELILRQQLFSINSGFLIDSQKENQDLLFQIFNFLGNNLIDTRFIQNLQILDYLNQFSIPDNGQIETILSGIKPQYRAVLYATLTFNPEYRGSPSQICRDLNIHYLEYKRIYLPLDKSLDLLDMKILFLYEEEQIIRKNPSQSNLQRKLLIQQLDLRSKCQTILSQVYQLI